MFLTPYYSQIDNQISVSAQQASSFAKGQCADFNPIHDPDNKRFCVPGDLLFSLALHTYGISETMSFTFTNMVGPDVALTFPSTDADTIVITNAQGKSVLEIQRSGTIKHDDALIESLIKNYVQFSGKNFPTLLMPLMEKHQVMFNPTRPLVMYNSMSFEFSRLNLNGKMHIELSDNTMEVETKRATGFLHFDFFDGENLVGKGIKRLVIAGLKPYDHDSITAFSDAYEATRDKALSAQG